MSRDTYLYRHTIATQIHFRPYSHSTCHTLPSFLFFFFNDTATTEIYTLSLHDALPISVETGNCIPCRMPYITSMFMPRSEEHTSELQSPCNLVCRLLLEKKKKGARSRRRLVSRARKMEDFTT